MVNCTVLPAIASVCACDPDEGELTAADYATDDFRMYCFKVIRCSKRYVHDWRTCPYSHPTENARRRDPREHHYLAIPCPEYKKGICMLGDGCPYAHGVYECWLHPSKYRTQLCKDGEGCKRPVCFFAHTQHDLRQPCVDFNPTPEELDRCERQRAQHAGAPMQPVDTGLRPVSDVPDTGLLHSYSVPRINVGSTSPARSISGIRYDTSDLYVESNGTGSSSPTSTHSSVDGSELAAGRQLGLGGSTTSFESQASGPRMSNALARKFGLVPQKDTKLRNQSTGSSSPPMFRSSLDAQQEVYAHQTHPQLLVGPNSLVAQQQMQQALLSMMHPSPLPNTPHVLEESYLPQPRCNNLALQQALVAMLANMNLSAVQAPFDQQCMYTDDSAGRMHHAGGFHLPQDLQVMLNNSTESVYY